MTLLSEGPTKSISRPQWTHSCPRYEWQDDNNEQRKPRATIDTAKLRYSQLRHRQLSTQSNMVV